MSRALIRRMATVFAGRSLARGAQFLVFVGLGRLLGPEAFGIYGLITASVVLAVQLGSLGLRQAAAVRLGQGETPPSQMLANLLLAAPLLAVLALGLLVPVLLPVMDAGPAHGLPADRVWGFLVLVLLGAMVLILMQGVLLGLGRTGLFGFSDSLMPLLMLAAVAGMLVTGMHGLAWALAALGAAHLLAGALAVGFALRFAGTAPPVPADLPGMIRQGLGFALNVFLILLATRMSLYLVEALMSPAAVGQFLVGQRLGDILGEIALAAGFVLFSDTVRARDRAAALRETARLAALVLWGFTLLALPLALLAEPLVALSFGAGYDQAPQVLRIVCLAIGPMAATKLIYPSLAAQGRPLWGTPAILAAITINILMSFLTIPRYGLAGAAVALVVSQFVLLLGYAAILRYRFAVPLTDSLIPRLRGDRS